MAEIGELLRKTREKKGLTLRDVEDATKIRYKYLEAIEEENFRVIPGTVYTKGFIRSYANYLGLDGNQILQMFKAQYLEPEEEVQTEAMSPNPTGPARRWHPVYWRYILGLALIVALVLVKAVYPPAKPEISPDNLDKPKVGAEKKTVPKVPEPKETPPAPSPAPSPPPVAVGINLILTITADKSWVSVVVDGAPAFTGILPAGTSKTFQGKEKIRVKLGNAPVVSVTVNGQQLGVLGAGKRVVEEEFSASGQG